MITSTHQNGNVLFYILLCIALFAALGYAFSRNSVEGTSAISDEKAKLLASEMVNYSNQLKEAMIKLRLRGCKDNEFNFVNPVYRNVDGTAAQGMSSNNNAPSDGRCNLFLPNGGSITPIILPQEAFDSPQLNNRVKSGHAEVAVAQIKDYGTSGTAGTTSANDLWIQFLWVNRPTCIAINNLLGNANPGGDPPVLDYSGSEGSYVNGDLSATNILANKFNTAFCYKSNAYSNLYGFLSGLLPR